MNKCATSSLVNGKQRHYSTHGYLYKSLRGEGPLVHLEGLVAVHERRVSQFRQGLKKARVEQQPVAGNARLEKALSLCKRTLSLVERSAEFLSDFDSISHRKLDRAA